MKVADNHLSIVSTGEIQQICQPFFKETGITYFTCARFYDTGFFRALPSHAEWAKHFWEQDHLEKTVDKWLKPGVNVWDSKAALTQARQEGRTLFNMDNRCDIIERGDNYYELFGFASAAGNDKIIDYYMNHREKLKQFILYFKDKASYLIKQAEACKENQFYLDEVAQYIRQQKNLKEENIPLSLDIKKYTLNTQEGKVSFSHKELISMLFILKGRTASQAARELNLSPKTVETYIASCKTKLNCNTKADLFDKAWECGIPDLLNYFSIKDSVAEEFQKRS